MPKIIPPRIDPLIEKQKYHYDVGRREALIPADVQQHAIAVEQIFKHHGKSEAKPDAENIDSQDYQNAELLFHPSSC